MSTSVLTIEARRVNWFSRAADYVELTKPRIGALVLVTVAVAHYLACWGQPDPAVLLHTLFGTLLVASSASALNQWLEQRGDALMARTATRPLPAGRLSSFEVVAFATVCVSLGVGYLAVRAGLMAAVWGALTWVLYVWVYTPLKSRTAANTAVGAVAGALPVLIGWSAAGRSLDLRLAALFCILYLWQFPHFMAIAWLYRQQYAQAGLRMLPVVDASGRRAGVQAVLAAVMLLPVSFAPALMSPGATGYVVAAFVLGVAQLGCAIAFCVRRDDPSARRLLRASLVYLPALLACLLFIPLV